MPFKNNAQKEAHAKVAKYLGEMFGSDNVNEWGDTAFVVPQGSAVVYVGVHPWSEDTSFVQCLCYVVHGAKITPELMEYLLRENATMRFGAFSLDQDNDIIFDYSVVGETLDKEEMKALLFSVAYTADKYDDEIIGKFGGKTSLAVMQEKTKAAGGETKLEW
jgi:hypothetical protein